MQFILEVGFFAGILGLAGCGSFVSITQSDEEIKENLGEVRTKCTYVNRIYGGVSYNFCKIHSQRGRNSYSRIFPDELAVQLLALDTAACALIDTIVLPYTLTAQIKHGPIYTN